MFTATSTLALFLCQAIPAVSVAPPPSEDGFRCPVVKGGSISWGNGQGSTHQDKFSFHAWDYNVSAGTTVVAARTGIVAKSIGWSHIGGGQEYLYDANEVHLRHSDGTTSLYLHLQPSDELPRLGEVVLQGERIGTVGNTGNSQVPHLHYIVWRNGVSVPSRFLDFAEKDGVPAQGDFHAAPPPPAVRQAVLDQTRALWRKADRLRSCAYPDVALAVLQEKPKGMDVEANHLGTLVLSLEAACAKAIREELARWASLDEPTAKDAMRLRRYRVTLKSRDEFDDALRGLKDFEDPLGDEAKVLRATANRIPAFVKALELDAEERWSAAVAAFVPLETRPGPLGEGAAGRIQAITMEREIGLRMLRLRLETELERCRPADRPAVQAATREHCDDAKKFWTAVSKSPSKKELAKEALKTLAEHRKALLTRKR